MRREHEVYALDCYGCGGSIEINCNGSHLCPKCGALFCIEWRAECPKAADGAATT